MKYYVDTNVILKTPEIIEQYDVVIPAIVLKEIENLELKRDNRQLQYEIRIAKRILYKRIQDGKADILTTETSDSVVEGFATDYADNIIVKMAKDKGLGIITNDILMILKCVSEDIPHISPMFEMKENSEFTGVKEFYINKGEYKLEMKELELMAQIELNLGGTENVEYFTENFDIHPNEYIIFWDKSMPTYRTVNGEKTLTGYKEVGVFKFDGERMVRVNSKKIKSEFETISPRNVKQRCAIDMLQDNSVKVKALFGTFGAGKDYLMLGQALSMVNDEACPIDKIVWVRNNVEVKDSNPIGFLPNTMEDKLMPFLMPLVDHLGGDKETLEQMMFEGKIEVQHLGFIRGRDIKNAIIYVTEVQSNTLEHIQLLIGRVSEGSEIWFNGDDKQTDSSKFESNNGVRALKKLANEKLYGQVTLDKTERSEVARLSAVLDMD